MAGGTLNLLIEIAALPDNRYRVTLRSPVGEAAEDLPAPFTNEEIAHYLGAFSGADPLPALKVAGLARELGDRLFAFVFRSTDALNTVYIASLERATANGNALRLRFAVERAGILASLPLEALRDPARDVLALSRVTPVVRSPQGIAFRTAAQPARPLRVLAILASPGDLPALDLEGEWTRLQEATSAARASGALVLVRLPHATLTDLRRELRTGEYHIVHFVGHSDYDSSSGSGALVFEGEDEAAPLRGEKVTALALGRELGEETTIRLVVLNSCHSAHRPARDPLEGIASGLIARGIPAIVGMQYAIDDEAAKVFAGEFYRALAEGVPIDAAMSEARRALAARRTSIDWLIPSLTLRADSGLLFDSAPAQAASGLKWAPLLMGLGLLVAALLLLIALASSLAAPPAPTPTAIVPTVPVLLPDLVVTGLRVSPSRPIPGQFLRVNISVKNEGEADSGPFTFTWDSSTGQPEQLNSFIGQVENIPPGASRNVSAPFIYGWWGTYNTLVDVDAQSEVRESNELNNRRTLSIPVANVPFEIDFTLVPPDTAVEPPFALAADSFAPWNLRFAPEGNPACANALLLADAGVMENGFSSIILTEDQTTRPECGALPLGIQIGRGPVTGAEVEVLPLEAGSVTLQLFSDAGGLNQVYSETRSGQPGVTLRLGSSEAGSLSVRRIRLSAPVRLTQLTLFPPAG